MFRSDNTSSYAHYEDAKFLMKYVDVTKHNHELYKELLKELVVLFRSFHVELYMKKFKIFGHMSYEKMCKEMFGTKNPSIDNWMVSGAIRWMNKQGLPKSCNDRLRDVLTSPRWYNYNLEKINEQITHCAFYGHKMSICTNDFRLLEWSLKLNGQYMEMISHVKELQGVVMDAAQNMDANRKNNS